MNEYTKRINELNNRIKHISGIPAAVLGTDKQSGQVNELRTQDFVKKMRTSKIINEIFENIEQNTNKKTIYDQNREEQKFRQYFDDLNVTVEFIELKVFDDKVFWGGTVDGMIQFVYKVTPDEKSSGVEFNYLEDFSPDIPENDEVVKRIEAYYNSFYKYWRDNILQK
jgi:hypothetical protein